MNRLKRIGFASALAMVSCHPQQKAEMPTPTTAESFESKECPTEIRDRIGCIKQQIADATGNSAYGPQTCEQNITVAMCRLESLRVLADGSYESPIVQCSEWDAESDRRTVDLDCLFDALTVSASLFPEYQKSLRTCDEEVLSCYEDLSERLAD